MTIEEYFRTCERHDWYFNYSDDHRVWRRGQDREDALRAETQEDKTKRAIFVAFIAHKFRGGQKPELSDYL